jgi:hypothetical protein
MFTLIEMFSSDEVEIYSSSDTGLHFLLVVIIIFARRVMHAQQETLTMSTHAVILHFGVHAI